MGEYDEILFQKPIRTKGGVDSHSHYKDKDPKYGRSRDVGDVSPEVQRQVINALVAAGKEAGLTDHDIDLVIATVRYESGFNPDAANKSGSAAGLGQFTNDTRSYYKVQDVFDITTNARAIARYYKRCKSRAIEYGRAGSQEELDRWTYGFYHDGLGGNDSGGNDIFSRPNGVKEWVGRVHKSRSNPKGVQSPKSSDFKDDRPSSYAAAEPATSPRAFDLNPFDPAGRRTVGEGEPVARWNALTPNTCGSDPMPPFPSPYETAFNRAGGPVFPNGPVPPSSSLPPFQQGNALASSPVPFEEVIRRSYAPTGQPQARPAVLPSEAGKPSYSLKDKLEFIGKVYPAAKVLSDKTGLSLPFILGHAAHEVDWGKNIEGNNLFNLKADENWQGPTYTRNDTRYRAYPTYAESMEDYQTFLESNPRYGKMFEPVTRASTDKLADAIRYAGYSEDPLYGMRVTTAAKSPLMKRALWQYDKWPPG